MDHSGPAPSRNDELRSPGLWDHIESYIRELIDDDPDDLAANMRPQSSSVRLGAPRAVPFRTGIPDGMPGSAPVVLEASADEVAATLATDLDTPERAVVEAIREDIEHIKQRYIIGRLVGRDMVSSQGQRIARQGDRITSHLVEQAEEAGRLVELIENMTFESFED